MIEITITKEQADQLREVMSAHNRVQEVLSIVFSCILAAAGRTEGSLVDFVYDEKKVVIQTQEPQ